MFFVVAVLAFLPVRHAASVAALGLVFLLVHCSGCAAARFVGGSAPERAGKYCGSAWRRGFGVA
jgi:hypothetical protein